MKGALGTSSTLSKQYKDVRQEVNMQSMGNNRWFKLKKGLFIFYIFMILLSISFYPLEFFLQAPDVSMEAFHRPLIYL